MKLLKHNPKNGKSVWVCTECDDLSGGKGMVKHRCPTCGHEDQVVKDILKYAWPQRPIGYTRTIPEEGDNINKAKQSIYRARRIYGMDISMRMTFAGLSVTVLSLPTVTPEGID